MYTCPNWHYIHSTWACCTVTYICHQDMASALCLSAVSLSLPVLSSSSSALSRKRKGPVKCTDDEDDTRVHACKVACTSSTIDAKASVNLRVIKMPCCAGQVKCLGCDGPCCVHRDLHMPTDTCPIGTSSGRCTTCQQTMCKDCFSKHVRLNPSHVCGMCNSFGCKEVAGVKVVPCDPKSSCQTHTCEHCNGMYCSGLEHARRRAPCYHKHGYALCGSCGYDGCEACMCKHLELHPEHVCAQCAENSRQKGCVFMAAEETMGISDSDPDDERVY